MSQTHRAVAIDGPAASGKSTVARRLAESLGLVMVNSGAMYRAVTWQILEEGIDPTDSAAVLEAMSRMKIDCGVEGGLSTISINGRLLTTEIRCAEVNDHVSKVASIPEVRERLVAMQRNYLEENDVVMEGRDIGSVVFPDTPFKLYISASEAVRAARRARDGEADAVAKRDAEDSRRKASPLKISDGSIVIDSSDLTIEGTVNAAREALMKLGWKD
ncbi:(d)CMP kinase [Akkermansiaceae bacterium]|nr:(d)CMP kinase [bacterium]MDA7891399.1 (d)CMP kinase [Akkermansiaceae bacterium]MDA7896043.1 (d)CMP kinase [bacterium]MDA7907531.1 (d)CMP kinase [Akkermansiaceae bacterium]MDA7933954.1 (d)CMP kinase [Akkermansiaceae bacterium]